MDRIDSIDLDPESYRGDDYFLVGYVEPAPENSGDYDPEVDADDYGWSLVQKKQSPLDGSGESL
jgi:hypothetical protein